MATPLPLPTSVVPESGQLVGGPLDGWAFGAPVIDVERGRVVLRVRVTPPHWPFPLTQPVTLGTGQFRGLRGHAQAQGIDVQAQLRRIAGATP